MIIAFFDFDGTITKKDSLVEFIQFSVGKPSYYLGLLLLSPMLFLYKINIITNHIAKEKLIGYFFSGWDYIDFKKVADNYALTQIDKITRSKAIEKINWHKQQGHKVVIVTASVECWLKRWCEDKEIDLIGTHLEVKSNKITGTFSSKNCYGAEKVNRINVEYDISLCETLYAYGDSAGDKEMLAMADKSYYKLFI